MNYQLVIFSSWNILNDLYLADQNFYKTKFIDLLIDAELFWKLIKLNKVHLGKSLPILQETLFGYIITGIISSAFATTHCNFSKDLTMANNLQF